MLIVDYVNIVNSNNVYQKLKTDSKNEHSNILIDNPDPTPVAEVQIKQNENINKDENIGVNEIKNSDGQEAVSEPSNSSHISNDTTIETINASWDNIISYIDQ